jgi:hypothetical protein
MPTLHLDELREVYVVRQRVSNGLHAGLKPSAVISKFRDELA